MKESQKNRAYHEKSVFFEEELKMILFHKTNPELIWADEVESGLRTVS